MQHGCGLTQYPLPILKATIDQIRQIYKSTLGHKNLLMADITDAAQTNKNYADYEEKLFGKSSEELKLLGLAVAGPSKLVNKLTGNLALLR